VDAECFGHQVVKKMRQIDKRVVWEGNFLRMVVVVYEDCHGEKRNWEAVERVNCSGIVVIVPITEQNELLLVRQFRPAMNNFVIEFPSGLNDRDELLVDVARRELIEETGYMSNEVILLAEGPVSSGITTEILSVFLAKNASPALPELRKRYPCEVTEEIELIKTSFSAVSNLLGLFQNKGDHVDLKMHGLIELAKKKL